MQVVKYQLDENVDTQVLKLPSDYDIMCVKKNYVDGKMCPCLYVLKYDTEPGGEDDVTLHFVQEFAHYPDTNQMDYIGEYVSGISYLDNKCEYRTFVFITYNVISAAV